MDKRFILKNQNWILPTCDSFPLIVSHFCIGVNSVLITKIPHTYLLFSIWSWCIHRIKIYNWIIHCHLFEMKVLLVTTQSKKIWQSHSSLTWWSVEGIGYLVLNFISNQRQCLNGLQHGFLCYFDSILLSTLEYTDVEKQTSRVKVSHSLAFWHCLRLNL